jgi:hypothetical protein
MKNTVPDPIRTQQLTVDELREIFGLGLTHPADLREQLRAKLSMLPTAARAVYCRDNIANPDTPLITVVETVLYHFDIPNRKRVAAALKLSYDDMILLLAAFVLGYEMRPRICSECGTPLQRAYGPHGDVCAACYF